MRPWDGPLLFFTLNGEVSLLDDWTHDVSMRMSFKLRMTLRLYPGHSSMHVGKEHKQELAAIAWSLFLTIRHIIEAKLSTKKEFAFA